MFLTALETAVDGKRQRLVSKYASHLEDLEIIFNLDEVTVALWNEEYVANMITIKKFIDG